MGCCAFRELQEYDSFEYAICQAELSLGFKNRDIIKFDQTLYRFSSNYFMSESQFSEFSNYMKLDKSSKCISDFYYNFYDTVKFRYSIKTLSTLAVLIGEGSINDKVKILFQTYDNNLNMILSEDEIKMMFGDICFIVLDCFPSLASKLEQDWKRKNELMEYRTKLANMRQGIVNYYSFMVFENHPNKEIHLDDFLKLFRDENLQQILIPTLFRKCTLRLLKFINKAVNATLFVLDDDRPESHEVLEEIKLINSASRRHRSNLI